MKLINHIANKKGLLVLTLFLITSSVARAQEAGTALKITKEDVVLWSTLFIITFVLVVLVYFISAVNSILELLKGEPARKVEKGLGFNNAVPIERESEILLDHNYDGIQELDNQLPSWWVYMFYLTIVFSVVYMVYYHYLGGALQDAEYQQEIVAAEKLKAAAANAINETNVERITDAARLEKGKAIYLQNCGACHGREGEGGVGPNLVDKYWLHGGNIKDIFKVITNGVPQKGMISWKSQLNPAQIQDVASYILSIQGTNPPNAKEPQGELYEE
ncbi:MAG TPA: cbb3-type cytochrome c oxidase N-terminal domain-containing protein [Cytophagaceae bacterium]